MKKKYLLVSILLFSCSTDKTIINNLENIPKTNINLLIEQKKTSGEIIPIGPKAVKNLSINNSELPLNKLIENQLKININDITLGKHELELSLYFLNQDLKVPIIIPNLNLKDISFIMRVNIDEKTHNLNKIEYGYDIDKNGIIDADRGIFETENGKDFFINLPNNERLTIDLALDKIINTTENNIIPAGTVPYNPPQNIDSNIIQRNDINLPKPIVNNNSIYPVLPQIDDNKKD